MAGIALCKAVQVEALPGVLGNRGTGSFISGEQGNKGKIWRGLGEQRQYWGTGNIENKFSHFGEQGNKPIYFRGTREQVPPPPPPGRVSGYPAKPGNPWRIFYIPGEGTIISKKTMYLH